MLQANVEGVRRGPARAWLGRKAEICASSIAGTAASAERAKAPARRSWSSSTPEVDPVPPRRPILSRYAAPPSTIPIVFLAGVRSRWRRAIVTSVTRPGGNRHRAFRLTNFRIGGKWLELLKEVAPKLTRVARDVESRTQLRRPNSSIVRSQSAAPAFKIEVIAAPVRSDGRYSSAHRRSVGRRTGGLILPTDTYTRLRHDANCRTDRAGTASRRLSAVSAFVDEGGLLYYGQQHSRRSRLSTGRRPPMSTAFCKGAKPGDLPVQAPTKYRPAHQPQDGEALSGWKSRRSSCFTADEVIE